MEDFFTDIGEPRFRAVQVLKWVYQCGVVSFDEMTNLNKGLRGRLKEIAEIQLPRIVRIEVANDGTHKWLVELEDSNCIEMVFIPDEDRGTLCISPQVGCALNCTFCATARQGYSRNLSTAEIIGQLWLAKNWLVEHQENMPRLTNVVLMGMGEPLLNFENVVSAMRLMLDDNSFGLSRRRITLSTAGVVPKIDQLRELCPVSLAVSLHAPNDELRDELVPINRKYPIAILLNACRRYVADNPRSKVTFEYVMLRGINDSIGHARELRKILCDVPAKVNLIPFNGFVGSGFERSDQKAIDDFRNQLLAGNIMTVTRKTRGDDIAAACGQLAGRVQDRTKRSQLYQAKLAVAH